MTYNETLNWMFAQLPMYQRIGQAAYKADLNNTLALDKYFSHPHEKFKTIHIAGTNGKGSVSHYIASVLQEAGYRVGLYTSPHLKDFRERVKINGEMMPESYVIDFIGQNKEEFKKTAPSFFEMTVAMAFKYFADQKVDIAVIEVGLGGRLDSTNIITPLLSVITNISFDHMALLGDTLVKIAGEKAGIIKAGIPAVVGVKDDDYADVFIKKAQSCDSELTFASEHWTIEEKDGAVYDCYNDGKLCYENLSSELKGIYQRKNLKTVLEAVGKLRHRGLNISDNDIFSGIAKVISNTGLYGRWQQLSDRPYTICDTGHNVDGISEIVKQLGMQKYNRLHIVLGMVNDKDVDAVLAILPKDAIYYFCKASIPRAMNENILAEKAAKFNLNGLCYETVDKAWDAAKKAADDDDMIYIGGSTFVVAEVI